MMDTIMNHAKMDTIQKQNEHYFYNSLIRYACSQDRKYRKIKIVIWWFSDGYQKLFIKAITLTKAVLVSLISTLCFLKLASL